MFENMCLETVGKRQSNQSPINQRWRWAILFSNYNRVPIFIAYFILSHAMKERIIYSPKLQKNQLDLNFKKSPQKFVYYDSPKEPHPLPVPQQNSYETSHRDFQHVKKLSEEASSLRQTMNYGQANRIAKRHTLYDFQEEDKPNKLSDLLRQTMSYKSTRAWSQNFGSTDLTNSNEVTLKKDETFNQYKSHRLQEPYRIAESRSAINLLEGQKNLEQFELLNQKIDRNKRLIEQLRKGSKEADRNYLKNVNYNKSPTYLDLDHEKQIDEKGFRKKHREQAGQFMTPKLSKGTYDTRFNSTPLIDIDHKHEPKDTETIISSLKIVSPRRKTSLASNCSDFSMVDEFDVGKKLGEGKFGCVNIARHKKTQGIFAIKKIPKAMIKSHMMIDQLALEIRLQSCLKNKNILQMYGFFDDKTHLYIILEYMDGGTLYQKLKKGKLSEKETSAIVRQITLSIDYLHDMGIAHRDLKPQNIVISNNVYKLCDFGWAAMCNERRKTYCGTFDYVAPEILEGVQYDMTVDLWCLGVMTFQLMTGKAPFYHISRKQTMKKILNVETQSIQFPEGMSELARDFIQKLVRKNPLERIKASQALLHPFIKDADFDYD